VATAGEVKNPKDRRILELVRQLRTDPYAREVASELSARSAELTREDSDKRFTYNKLWWLIMEDPFK
jgi:hypothetical protein